jgi:PAS domain S-box-containing protein
MLDILHVHPTVVYRGSICKNPYYVPPDEFLHPQRNEREVQRMLARMQEDTANIEKLRQSEKRIRRSSAQHKKETRALIDTIPQQIWSGPPDGRLDFCNERWRSYMGLSLEELQGSGWQSMLHPDDRDRVLKAWRESVENGTPYEQEERHRGTDGNYRWFLSRGVPMRDAEGRILRWYGTNTDIEDRKRTEAYLAEAQRLSHTGSWAYDLVRRVPIYLSPESYRIIGLDPAERLTVEKNRALHTPEEWSRVWEVVARAVAEKADYQFDTHLVFPDGSTKYIHIVGHPVVDASGEVVELVGTVMDITERKRSEERVRKLTGSILRSQDEERRRIARELHDSTGQDLVALATVVEQIRESVPSRDRKTRRLLFDVKALADKCVRDLRTLSYVLHPPALDQAGLVGALREHVKGFTKRSGIQVEVEVSPHVTRMAPDIELALFRVIQESLTNIRRHSGSQHAKIRMNRNSDLTLEISDSHRSSSARLRTDTSESPFQFGVGIASMQERIISIGGRLEIYSTSSGTIVRVTIPVGER